MGCCLLLARLPSVDMVVRLDMAGTAERGLLLALLGLTTLMALPCLGAVPFELLDSLLDAWDAAICRERSSRRSAGYAKVEGNMLGMFMLICEAIMTSRKEGGM
jgi:hypothetical protein